MVKAIKLVWPELLASAVLLAAIAWMASDVVRETGEFVYCLDDAYIHLAIAKNLALHHVWGVTRYEFSSASSSPLWALILAAGFVVAGVDSFAPLSLNVLAGIAAIWIAGSLLRRRGLPQSLNAVALIAIVAFAPLPTLVMAGMEHTLHIALVFAWLSILDAALRGPTQLSSRTLIGLAVFAPILTVCRFESLALMFCGCAVIFLRGSRREALIIGAAAWSSVAAYAAFSISRGWHALPNSVLMKAPEVRMRAHYGLGHWLGGNFLSQLGSAWHLTALLVASWIALTWLGGRSLLDSPRALILVFCATACLHMQFATLGWFYRYEAYLVAMGILAVGVAAAEHRPGWRTALAMALLSIPLATRGFRAATTTAAAAGNIHDEQWQMGQFLRQKMGEESVLLNDIGAASFLSDARIADAAGLGSGDMADMIIKGGFTTEAVSKLARDHRVGLAIVNRAGIPGVPDEWRALGSWTAPEPHVLGDPTTTFYAVDVSRADEFSRRIRDYSASLPEGTVVRMVKQR